MATLGCCDPPSDPPPDSRPVTEHPTDWCWDQYPTGQASAADRQRCFATEWAAGWDNGTGVHCVDIYADNLEIPCAPDMVQAGFHEPADPANTVGIYGIHSGFAKARLGVSGVRKTIVVGWLPGLDYDETGEVIDRALDEWNMAAGWQVFILDTDNVDTDVSWHINDERLLDFGAWTEWDQFQTGWYRHCRIYTHTGGPPLASTYAHELGHCLGFEDVPDDTGYYGIMSYGRRGDTYPDNAQDRASLAEAGYRVS